MGPWERIVATSRRQAKCWVPMVVVEAAMPVEGGIWNATWQQSGHTQRCGHAQLSAWPDGALPRRPSDGVFDKVLQRTPIRSRLHNRRTPCVGIHGNRCCRLGWAMLACLDLCPCGGVLVAKFAPPWWACIHNRRCSATVMALRSRCSRGGVEYTQAWSWLAQHPQRVMTNNKTPANVSSVAPIRLNACRPISCWLVPQSRARIERRALDDTPMGR